MRFSFMVASSTLGAKPGIAARTTSAETWLRGVNSARASYSPFEVAAARPTEAIRDRQASSVVVSKFREQKIQPCGGRVDLVEIHEEIASGCRGCWLPRANNPCSNTGGLEIEMLGLELAAVHVVLPGILSTNICCPLWSSRTPVTKSKAFPFLRSVVRRQPLPD